MKLNYNKLEKLFVGETITRLLDMLLCFVCIGLMWHCANNGYHDWLIFWGFLAVGCNIPPAIRPFNVLKSIIDLEEKGPNP